MGVNLGDEVGYTIRFEDHTTSGVTSVKFLTDGVLIREMMEDPLLTKYSVIMVDEAHERSISTDILLGLLKKIQRRRPELRLIISSATIEAKAMFNFFNTSKKRQAPEGSTQGPKLEPAILSVEGRGFSVKIHYVEEPVSDYIRSVVSTILLINERPSDFQILRLSSAGDCLPGAVEHKDIEKDTWDFKSMTDDDPMDFGYGSPANKDKKKNAFNMDMSFDLGGDFGSSFKMDMSDFDFSSPAKKTTKTKQNSDDSGDLKQKKNPFHFSCDFDALGDLDLDSNPRKKGNETTTKSMDFEEFSGSKLFDKSDSLDFGPDLPTTRQAVSRANTDVKANASAEKENQNSKGADSMSSTHSKQADSNNSTHSKQATLESKEDFEEVDSPQRLRMGTSRVHTMRVQPQPANISPLRTSYSKVEENSKPCLSNETAALSPLHSSEIAHTAASRETSPGIHEICRSGTKEDSPRDTEQNTNSRMISTTKSSYEKTEPNMSSQSGLDKIKHQQEEMDTDTQAEIQDHTRRTLLCDPDAGHSQPTLSGKVPSGSQLGQTAQVQDSSSKLPQAPSDSVPRLSDLKAMQNSDSGHIRSMFFKKIEKPQSHVLESPTQTEIRLVTHERIGSNLNPTIDKRLDTKDALAGSKTRTAPTELSKTDSETENVNTNSSSHEKIIQKDHSGTRTVSSQASRLDNNTTKQLVKESPRAKPQPQFMNMANLEIPITEYDENIEKAESYTKELDNICNILKKKNEEAKELLVRAVVNNNKLLMLNHPLHEDKISFY
ncbi:hypothetical protein F2Q68_00029427 [Brassica cretica]|uniref:Helicase ATP-binding domain-containing protein n=1 Tax=Brassica cretica TaxID=69181 RepID=A0A8S9GGX3_BRACR|nr:hypothetical protein F2Q68_00029427 [Brassica cretica]